MLKNFHKKHQISLHENMNKRELKAFFKLEKQLQEQGFPTLAKILREGGFQLNFLTSEEAGQPFAAAIDDTHKMVYINPGVNFEKCAGFLMRHEIGHYIFKHWGRMLLKLKERGIENFEDLCAVDQELYQEIANKAADYHLSNTIYDNREPYHEFSLAKNLMIGGETFPGLVTELDFKNNPEYWTMDFEQLFDIFVKDFDMMKKNRELMDKLGKSAFNPDFVEGWNEVVDAYNSGEFTEKELRDWLKKNGSLDESFIFEYKSSNSTNALDKLFKRSPGEPAEKNSGKIAAANVIVHPESLKGSQGGQASNPLKIPKNVDSKSENSEQSQPRPWGNLSKEKLDEISKKIADIRKQAIAKAQAEGKDTSDLEDLIDENGNLLKDMGNHKAGENLFGPAQDLQDLTDAANSNAQLIKIDELIDKHYDELVKETSRSATRNRERFAKKIEFEKRHKYNSVYKNFNIDEIINDMTSALATDFKVEKKRITDYTTMDDDRSRDRGYIAFRRKNIKKFVQTLPQVVFYFDNSGSWSGNKEKYAIEQKIEKALKQYDGVYYHLIVRYFATKCSFERSDSATGGGNNAEPTLDITKPPLGLKDALLNGAIADGLKPDSNGKYPDIGIDNIIIATDDNPSDCKSFTVPGRAWLLFYDSYSDSLIQATHADKGVKIFMIDHDNEKV